jgi:hypothetical protein
MRYAIASLGVFALFVALAAAAHAEDMRNAVPPPPTDHLPACFERGASCSPMPCRTRCEPRCWRVTLSVGGWLFGQDGHATVRGRRTDVDLSPADSLDALFDYGEGVFQGRLRASYGRWTFRAAGSTLTLGDGAEFSEGPVSGIDAELGLDLFQADVGYLLGKSIVGGSCDCPSTLSYDVFAGFRYFNVDAAIEARGVLAKVSGSKDFFDPIIGARATLNLGNRWSIDLEGDLGGFGVGSDLSWSLRAGVRYQVARWFSAEVGYKLLDIDYAEGAGANRFEWDMLLSGPYLALNFHF